MRIGEWNAHIVGEFGTHPAMAGAHLILWRECGKSTAVEVLQADGTIAEHEACMETEKEHVFCTLPAGALQAIMDKMWGVGVRPKDRRHDEERDLLREQLAIQEKHLEDMRSLVFSLTSRKAD